MLSINIYYHVGIIISFLFINYVKLKHKKKTKRKVIYLKQDFHGKTELQNGINILSQFHLPTYLG